MTNIPHGVCMFDAQKRLILCNPGYSRLYTLPPELTVAGKAWTMAVTRHPSRTDPGGVILSLQQVVREPRRA